MTDASGTGKEVKRWTIQQMRLATDDSETHFQVFQIANGLSVGHNKRVEVVEASVYDAIKQERDEYLEVLELYAFSKHFVGPGDRESYEERSGLKEAREVLAKYEVKP